MSALAKFGSPEWKPISETRHAELRVFVVARCGGCDWTRQISSIAYRPDAIPDNVRAEAQEAIEKHDASHDLDMASCCMYSTGAVCACGNVLV